MSAGQNQPFGPTSTSSARHLGAQAAAPPARPSSSPRLRPPPASGRKPPAGPRACTVPAKPGGCSPSPDAISQLENLDRTLLTRRDIERLFGVSKLVSLPEGVTVERDQIEVRFSWGEERDGAALRAGFRARERLRAVRGAGRSRRRWSGRGGEEMTTEALVPAAGEPAVATGGAGEIVVPQGDRRRGAVGGGAVLGVLRGADREREDTVGVTGERWGNSSGVVRGARPRAARRQPLHVAAYIRTHPGSVPTVKQHLAAVRMLGHWLVVSQILPVNPAAAVRAPKHVVATGATPVLSPAEAKKLLALIDAGALAGLRDRALLLRDALQLRAGERGVGDAAAGLLRAGEPGVVEALREGRKAARRAGPPPGCGCPRRLRRGGRARGAEGGALPEPGSRGPAADGPRARAAARLGDDQAARRGSPTTGWRIR